MQLLNSKDDTNELFIFKYRLDEVILSIVSDIIMFCVCVCVTKGHNISLHKSNLYFYFVQRAIKLFTRYLEIPAAIRKDLKFFR